MATIYRFTTALGATLAILAIYTTSATLPMQQANGSGQESRPVTSAPIGVATSNTLNPSPQL